MSAPDLNPPVALHDDGRQEQGGESSEPPLPTVLEKILRSTRAQLVQRKRERPLEDLRDELRAGAGPSGDPFARERRFHTALRRPGMSVIAEFKRRSPSAGPLVADADLQQILGAYRRGGASAVSVLTEGPHFDGSLEDLRLARAACDLPILRKDFVVDPYQLYEARVAGADAVLLIVAALDPSSLGLLHDEARSLDLDVLVEVHDEAELDRALSLGADLIGINNRDLRDFSVDVERTSRLMRRLGGEACVVSESGIKTAEQLRQLEAQGVQAVLVGESLMRAPDPEAALMELRGFRPPDGLL
jgi:indole-3-glycerol phosphate synthase